MVNPNLILSFLIIWTPLLDGLIAVISESDEFTPVNVDFQTNRYLEYSGLAIGISFNTDGWLPTSRPMPNKANKPNMNGQVYFNNDGNWYSGCKSKVTFFVFHT